MTRSRQEIYDELLVIRCRRRDLAAWDELVERWNARLLYYLRRLIENEQDATNALQEVWLHAFRGIAALRDDARLAAWLYAIARRAAVNHFRQDYARLETSSPEEIDDTPEEEGGEHLRLENAELVHFGLARLRLPEREVLTLYFLQDLSIAEIAALLDVPEGTVKSRLFKARRALRRVLESEGRHAD